MNYLGSLPLLNSKQIILCCLFLCLAAPAGTYSQNGVSQKPQENARLILTTATVYNRRDGLVADLNKSVFTVYDNKEAQEITYFTNDDQPISIGIVVDGIDPRNETQPNRTARMIGEGLSSFFEKSNKSNEYFLVGSDKGQQLFTDWTSHGSTIVDKLLAAKLSGPVYLHDACIAAFNKLRRGKYSKKVLLVIANGGHTPPADDMKDLKEAFKKSNVLAYFVFPPTSDYLTAAFATSGYRELALFTGGAVFDASVQPSTKLLGLFLEQIGTELRHQYTIGFISKPPADGKYHRITVKLVSPEDAASELKGLKVRTRDGYLAVSY